jgi:hypothetical protein
MASHKQLLYDWIEIARGKWRLVKVMNQLFIRPT